VLGIKVEIKEDIPPIQVEFSTGLVVSTPAYIATVTPAFNAHGLSYVIVMVVDSVVGFTTYPTFITKLLLRAEVTIIVASSIPNFIVLKKLAVVLS